ncbi:MAG: zinc-binding alcohol dehydrogenase family protein [Acetobacteraceae bacterium]
MKVLVCEAPGRLVLHERPAPVAGPGEALLRIRRVGVCGTDYHIFQGNQPYLAYPRVMGHEIGAEIVSAPAGSRFAPHDPVLVMPYLSCGACIACRQGRTNCCTRLSVLGVHQDGAMAELLAVPERFLLPCAGISAEQAAMVEFLAIGAHAVRRAGELTDRRVLVVGAGPIGIAVMIFAMIHGGIVTALDLRGDRLEFCADVLGVGATVALGAGDEAALARLTEGDFYDVVFDATGSARAMERGFGFVAHGGRYVLVSIVTGEIRFSDPEFHKRETTLLSSRNATEADFAEVLRAIRAGLVPTSRLATHAAPIEEAAEAFAHWLRPESAVIKAMIEI